MVGGQLHLAGLDKKFNLAGIQGDIAAFRADKYKAEVVDGGHRQTVHPMGVSQLDITGFAAATAELPQFDIATETGGNQLLFCSDAYCGDHLMLVSAKRP